MQTISAIQETVEQLYQEISQSSLKHWINDPKFAKKLDEKIREWAYQAKSNLDQLHPYQDQIDIFEYWKEIEHINADDFKEVLKQYQGFVEKINTSQFTDFWQYQFENSQVNFVENSHLQLQFKLLKEKWQRKLTEAIAQWEFEQLALLRDSFLDEIKDFLATLQKMAKHKESLGIDTGIFIDYSSGKLTSSDVNKFEEWMNYLENDPVLLKLCNQIGTAQPANFSRKNLPFFVQPDNENYIQDQMAKEEIIGIQYGQDLSLVLPSELALLSDPDLEILFDLKYLESNLMSFKMQGSNTGRVIQDNVQPIKKLGQKGPMILCLDTSGSMHGQPELIAKAMTLFLSTQAMQSKRSLYLINFSTNLMTLQLDQKQALDDLVHFLSQSFHGGTDIIPALTHAVEMLEHDDFKYADIVVISDFIMGNLSEELHEKIQNHKSQGTGFYAVAIGNLRLDHQDANLFDHQWVYQPEQKVVVKVS